MHERTQRPGDRRRSHRRQLRLLPRPRRVGGHAPREGRDLRRQLVRQRRAHRSDPPRAPRGPGRLVAGRQVDAQLREPLLHQAAGEPRPRPVALALPGGVHAGPGPAGDAAPPAAERGEPRALPRVRREGARLRLPAGRLADGILHAGGTGPRPRGGQAAPGGRRDRGGPGRRAGTVARARPAERRHRRPLRPGRRPARAGPLRQGARQAGGVRRCAGADRDRSDRLPDGRRAHHWGRDDARHVLCGHGRPGSGCVVAGCGPDPRASRADPAGQGLQPHLSAPGPGPLHPAPARRGPLLRDADGRVPPVRRNARARRDGPVDQPTSRGNPPAEGIAVHRGGESLELLEIWRGLRPCTPDGLPLVGRPRRYDNLVMAAGHAMVGMSLGPATGKLVAQLAGGSVPPNDVRLLDPDRFG